MYFHAAAKLFAMQTFSLKGLQKSTLSKTVLKLEKCQLVPLFESVRQLKVPASNSCFNGLGNFSQACSFSRECKKIIIRFYNRNTQFTTFKGNTKSFQNMTLVLWFSRKVCEIFKEISECLCLFPTECF